SGSIGLDLAAAVDVTLMTPQPVMIPTGLKAPTEIRGQKVGALLLGRSSASILGLFVLPGVIDADYTGEIMIMAHTPFPPLQIKENQRIAQLVPLPQMTKGLTLNTTKKRGTEGFGSTSSLTLMTLDLSDRPKKRLELED
ncbi:POK9 protein, partial [Eudromia elegans]|nr:POK9 protein [Eudromia elegans]